jgi:hypothetical protein
MNDGMRVVVSLILAADLVLFAQGVEPKTGILYENNFEKAELRKVPEGMDVLEGGFTTMEEGGNKFLELPGAPLETFGVLFGPAETNGIAVSARVFGTGRSRRGPTFAVGLNGVSGYKLRVSPAKKTVELYRGDDPPELLGSAPYNWESETWTVLLLQSRSRDGSVLVQGKAWKHGTAEPKEWLISHQDKAEPPPGRPSIWGAPYSGTPVRFDDLIVTAVR